MKFRKYIFTVVAAMMVASTACAADSSEAALEKSLHEMYPGTQFTAVHQTGIAGIYEVDMGRNIGYTNAEGRFFIFGHVFDMKTQQDLTAQRLEEMNVVDFAQLPLKDAIKTVHGKGSRKVAIFSDPDCPYCRKLETELLKLDNVTIYTFLYPLDGLHPESSKKAKSIWCSVDVQKAWHEYMIDSKQPVDKTDCANPIDRNMKLGQKLNINGTPTLIASDGRVMPGVASLEQLDGWVTKGGK
jgi:thiol:disulfide interchange protein DsbC